MKLVRITIFLKLSLWDNKDERKEEDSGYVKAETKVTMYCSGL